MVNVDARSITKEIEYYGDTVTVRVVNKDSFSKWGDVTESTSDTSNVKCMINIMSETDKEVKEGIFKSGDIRFWFASSQSIKRGDRIQYNSNWYEVNNVVSHSVASTTLIKEVRVEKV